MRDRTTIEWVGCLICFNCIQNLEYSQWIIRMVLQAAGNAYSADDMQLYVPVRTPVIQIIKNLLVVNDPPYNEDRMQLLFGFPQLNMNSEGSFALTTNIHGHAFSYPSTLRGEDRPMRSLLDLMCK